MLKRSGVVGGVALCIAVASAHAQPALDKAPFAASPKELLAVAATVTTDDYPTVILREEEDATFDAEGRRRWRWRRVFVVRTQAGVDGWGTFGAAWSPFYQDRPSVRARVIDPTGSVAELDQKLLTDAPQTSTSSTVFSDRRDLDAPLPRLRIGSVVEEELVITDRQPILPGAGMWTVSIGASVPIRSTRIVLSTPPRKGALHSSSIPGGAKPKYAAKGDRETWTLELGPLPAIDPYESYAPRDVLGRGFIGASMTSWNTVAREYRKLVDKRIGDGPFALPPHLPRTPSIETVRAITAWLHANVRYTGIEFDEASNIPWTPAETANRGFGDCKDKATLLIALLRQVGIRAEIVLLSTGPGFDVIKELPGMGVFDHAIVRAQVGAKDVWIDATEDLLPPGQLPGRDQARRALVIADTTTTLVDTPSAAPTDNTIKETRTFELAENGNAKRVTEVAVESGVFAAGQRAWIRDGKPSDVHKALASYVEKQYAAKLVRYSTTPPADLATPFAVTVEAQDVGRAHTERGHIDVYLYPTTALVKVPSIATEPDKQRKRRNDFVWYTPHVYEIENRLVVPPGYTMPALPADRVHQLGPAKLTERQRVEGNTLVVSFRFETGKPRMTPAELETMQKEIEALDKAPTQVVFEHAGWALATRGKWREAIVEIEKLVALHPKEAVHHTQLAFVFIQAGMGAAARRAARKAVELEPTNADAHVVLGWVLRHDTLGRELRNDFDRAGSIAAYQKARKLDPKHVGAHSDLAEVLEHDAAGVKYAAGSDLAGAAAARREAFALEDSDENALAYARALLYAKQFGEMEAVLRKRASSDDRDGLLIAAIAGSAGTQAAIEAAGRLRAGSAKASVLQRAGASLVLVRKYEKARALLAETNALPPGSTLEKIMANVKRQDRIGFPDRDPRAAITDLAGLFMDAAYQSRFMWDAATEMEQAQDAAQTRQQLQPLRSVGLAFFMDIMYSLVEAKVEGSGPWRVEIDMVGTRAKYDAALDKNVAKIIGSPDQPRGLGRHLLRLLAAKQEAQARVLLDWLVEDLRKDVEIGKLWKTSRDKTSLALIAALLAGSTDAAQARPILERCETQVPALRELCDGELAFVYLKEGKWRELEQHTASWLRRKPDSESARRLRVNALSRLGRFDEADAYYASTNVVDEPFLTMTYAEVAVARGNFDEAFRRYEPIVKQSHDFGLNQVAWLTVVAEKDLPRGLELASRAAGTDKRKAEPTVLNTLAVVEAELGHLHAAKADGWQAMANRLRHVPLSQDWYVYGRIAEQLGLRDDAIAAYRKCTPAPHEPSVTSVHTLAQRRLRQLGVAK